TATDNVPRTNDVTGIVLGTIRTNRSWWTLGSRPRFTEPGNPRRFGIPDSRPAVRHGLDHS
ncbi:MAG: hypothetical protein ACPHTH_07865, partial [Candidatus Poseidoniaceae archaeon]